MAPKKYTARSIQAAISHIKEELGPDAMILSTRRIPGRSHSSYSKDIFEVTAVSSNNVSKTKKGGGSQPPLQNKHLFCSINDDLDSYLNGGDAPVSAAPDTGTIPLQSGLKQTDISGHSADSIQAELAGIKKMLYLINEAKGLPALFQTHPECVTLYSRLIHAGISEKRAQRFISVAQTSATAVSPGPQEITKSVLEQVLAAIETLNPFRSNSDTSSGGNKRHLAAFIGPTGVGKTTTIAKLAADLSLKRKKRVGLISIDSYRIGALEQLKTYSAIMGLPCLPAFSDKELQIAVEKMRNREIILIDTAGHSHLDEKRMKELERLMGGNLDISSHLVLSVSTRRTDMKEAAEYFSLLKPQSYVFTKVDETRRKGGIIDQILDYPMPISFITNGQRVPEDFLQATRKNVLRLILQEEL